MIFFKYIYFLIIFFSLSNDVLLHKSSSGFKVKCGTFIKEAENFIDNFIFQIKSKTQILQVASWNYLTNLTTVNQAKNEELANSFDEWFSDKLEHSKTFENKMSIIKECNQTLAAFFNKLFLSNKLIPNNKASRKMLNHIMSELSKISGSTTVERNGKVYHLEPELSEILLKSRDQEELQWAWLAWHNAVGPPLKELFVEAVDIQNEAATDNGYESIVEGWLITDFADAKIEDQMDKILADIYPLFEQLHAFVRRKLMQAYPQAGIKPDASIPIHLLGNMWGQQWDGIFDLVKPYPDVQSINVTRALLNGDYTPIKMFQLAESFYTSLGLEPMTQQFWQNSEIVRPADNRPFQCHASAFNMQTSKDFRIKMCTLVDRQMLGTIHHEMGHIEYYMLYRKQPYLFQRGANAAFHEAIGDTVTLSLFTDKHLKAIGLMSEQQSHSNNYKVKINNLMELALFKIAFLPFSYVVDKWRFRVFRDEIQPDQYNTEWWKMRELYNGLRPPVYRNDSYFDPGAKYHISNFIGYTRYFFSFIVQFQFHENLCKLSGHTGPLHECDIYESKAAGNQLRATLSLGGSRPWQEVMQILAGVDEFKADSILRYFDPLYQWLKRKNKGFYVGW